MQYFVMKDLGKDKYGKVKLHATVITTKLRETDKELTSSSQSRNNKRVPSTSWTSFDARKIMEVYNL